MTSFLFVCTGNICRSPLAELAMREEARRRNLELDIDSAGTGDWHTGDPPDPRARKTAKRHKLSIDGLRARQVVATDFDRFDHIIALDRSHLSALQHLQPAGTKARVSLMLDHVSGREGEDVIDPYYGPDAGFDVTWDDVTKACHALAIETLDHK